MRDVYGASIDGAPRKKIVCITKSVKCTRLRAQTAARRPKSPSSPMEAGRSTAVNASKSISQKDTSEVRFTLVPVNSIRNLSFFSLFSSPHCPFVMIRLLLKKDFYKYIFLKSKDTGLYTLNNIGMDR